MRRTFGGSRRGGFRIAGSLVLVAAQCLADDGSVGPGPSAPPVDAPDFDAHTPHVILVPSQLPNIDLALAAASFGDRIVVKGGVVAFNLYKEGVTVEGRGAAIESEVRITGNGSTLRGFKMRGAWIRVFADDVHVIGNRSDAGSSWSVTGEWGSRLVVESNRMTAGSVTTHGDDAVVRSNRIEGAITTWGARSTSEGNAGLRLRLQSSGPDGVVRKNRCVEIDVFEGPCLVESNTVQTARARGALNLARVDAFAPDVALRSNIVRHSTRGIFIAGANAEVSDNTVTIGPVSAEGVVHPFPAEAAIVVDDIGLSGAMIERNRVVHADGSGLVLTTTQASICDNELHGISANVSMIVTGSKNLVLRNEITQETKHASSGNGIQVSGDENFFSENRVSDAKWAGIFVLSGSGNVFDGNVVERAAGVGIRLHSAAIATVVRDCTVTGCDFGLANEAADTDASGNEFTGNRVLDVLAIAEFGRFVLNEFVTFDVTSPKFH